MRQSLPNRMLAGTRKGHFMRVIIISFFLSLILSSCHSMLFIHKHDDKRLISVEQFDWFVAFPDDNIEIKNMRIRGDHNGGYFLFGNKQNNLIVSFYIEPIVEKELLRNCVDSKCIRDIAWRELQPTLKDPKDIKLYEIGEVAIYEFILTDQMRQKNLYANLYKDGYWIDVHISKLQFEEGEQALFTNFVKSISFVHK